MADHKIYDNCPSCDKSNYVEVAEFNAEVNDYDLSQATQFLGLTEEELIALRQGVESQTFVCSCGATYNRYSQEYREQRELINKVLEI